MLLLGIAASLQVSAQKPNAPRSFELRMSMEEPWYMLDEMRMSGWSNKPLALYNLNERAQGSDAESSARLFLATNATLLGLNDPGLNDLELRNSRTSLAGTTLRFSQFFQDVQVYESETVLNLSPDNRITFVLNGYRRIPANFETVPTVTETEARTLVRDRIGATGRTDFETSRLVVYQLHETTRLAWHVRLVVESPIGDWENLVDAQTGEIFRCEDVSCYHGGGTGKGTGLEGMKMVESPCPLPPLPAVVNGTGNVFDADPLSSAAATYNVGGYTDGADANAAVLTAQLRSKTLNQITLNAGVHSLVGPYASIADFEAPNKGLFTQASSTFAFDRNADNFEAVNTYFQLDQSLRYINVTLGISLMPYQYAGGMVFDPSGLSGADNSHYISSNGRIAFGEGGVDDAEDADVILHEMGHGIHDWATTGGLSQVNGLSEGCGDYWAQSYSRSLNQWTSVQAPYQWVFNWDGHNPFWGGRITNYGALYPGGLVNQIHTDGQIWATCLMKIYDAIGRTNTDRAFLQGLMLTNSTTNQQDAAIAFRQAGINMGYSMADLTQITNFFTGCGYILPPFPVVYSHWKAERLNNQYVDLTWGTTAESNNRGFDVQRRLASEAEFGTVGFVAGHGTTDGASGYSFQDVNPSSEMSFYRLKQIDLDGNTRLSEVQAVAGRGAEGFAFGVSPNPVHDRLEAIVVGQPVGIENYGFIIRDLAGRKIAEGNAALGAKVEIPGVNELAPGVYFLEMHAGGQNAVQRFVKQ
jgi:zinc metalloprotease ZmpB